MFHGYLLASLKYKQIRVAIEPLVITVCRAMSQLLLNTYSSSPTAPLFWHRPIAIMKGLEKVVT